MCDINENACDNEESVTLDNYILRVVKINYTRSVLYKFY